MKRSQWVVLVASGALAASLAACGPSKEQVREDKPPVTTEEPTTKKVEEPVEELVVREVIVAEDPEFVEGLSEDAQREFREGVLDVYATPPDYERAAAHFREAIRLEPTFPEAYFNLGMVLQRQGRAADAFKVYQDALAAMPDNHDVKAYIGRVHLGNAKVAAAEGNAAERERLLQLARTQFEAVTAQEPDNTAANNGLALYWMMKGDLDKAEDFVKKVLEVDPINTVALNTRGLINYQKGNYLIAKWIYEQKVLRIDDKGEEAEQLRFSEAASEAWNNLALTYIKLEMLPEAVRSLQNAVETKPDNVEARMNLAAIYLSFLDYERAREQYDSVLQMQPDNVEAITGHGSALYGLGQYEDAVGHYRQVLEKEPARDDLILRIALIYETRVADLSKAIPVYEEYIAKKGLPPTHELVGKVKVLKMMEKGEPMQPMGDEGGEDGMTPLEGGEGMEPGEATPIEPGTEPAPADAPATEPGTEPAPADAPATEGEPTT